jgi:hypothetical protein
MVSILRELINHLSFSYGSRFRLIKAQDAGSFFKNLVLSDDFQLRH